MENREKQEKVMKMMNMSLTSSNRQDGEIDTDHAGCEHGSI